MMMTFGFLLNSFLAKSEKENPAGPVFLVSPLCERVSLKHANFVCERGYTSSVKFYAFGSQY
jgi:hypothetical protein